MAAHIPGDVVNEIAQIVGPEKARKVLRRLRAGAGLACSLEGTLLDLEHQIDGGFATRAAMNAQIPAAPSATQPDTATPGATPSPTPPPPQTPAPFPLPEPEPEDLMDKPCCDACKNGHPDQCACNPKCTPPTVPGTPGFVQKALASVNRMCNCDVIPNYLVAAYEYVLNQMNIHEFVDAIENEASYVHLVTAADANITPLTDNTGILSFGLTPTFPVPANTAILLYQESGQTLPWVAWVLKIAAEFSQANSPQWTNIRIRQFVGPNNATDISQLTELSTRNGREQNLADYYCGVDNCAYVAVRGFGGCPTYFIPWLSMFVMAIEVGGIAPVQMSGTNVQVFKPHHTWNPINAPWVGPHGMDCTACAA